MRPENRGAVRAPGLLRIGTKGSKLNSDEATRKLTRLAANHRWTWRSSARRLLSELPSAGPRKHPVQAVRELSRLDLGALLGQSAWVGSLEMESVSLDHLIAEVPSPHVVYFSPEFAISELVPQYSGGLGVLAGDHLKSASDLREPLAGVGLFYHRGFFRQGVGDDGQTEHYERHDPAEFGCADTGMVITVPMASADVRARVWRLDIGRSPLLLLDTDVPENRPEDVAICDRLYGSERPDRVRQELLLGIGGMRAVAAMGWAPQVVHLNEGHAGFAILEMMDEIMSSDAGDLETAAAAARRRVVFTTHTPVPAGIETFKRHHVEAHLEIWAHRWSVATEDVLALGSDPELGVAAFNMTALCLRHSRSANGVSRLHGEVSRRLFAGIQGGDRIGWVTNGVHARSWTHPEMQRLFDDELGSGWSSGDTAAWERAGLIEDQSIVAARRRSAELLSSVVMERTGHALDHDALVVVFARRFAPYKRATLLLRDDERLVEMLRSVDAPIQLIYAGKAHPADRRGKELLAELVRFTRRTDIAGRMIFVPGYDMEVARAMVSGCDVWLNTPIRPREASGTSGEKASLNGGLNCSILDGWWAEMYDGKNGWEIPASDESDPDRRDDEEATATFGILEQTAGEYAAGGSAGLLDRIRYAWMDLGPKVTAARMVRDYRDRMYGPELATL